MLRFYRITIFGDHYYYYTQDSKDVNDLNNKNKGIVTQTNVHNSLAVFAFVYVTQNVQVRPITTFADIMIFDGFQYSTIGFVDMHTIVVAAIFENRKFRGNGAIFPVGSCR